MILDLLSNAGRSLSLHPLFAQAFAFAHRPDAAALPDGRHPIAGDRLYAVVARGPGRPRAEALLEAHRRYIDIQIALGSGTDTIGWAPLAAVAGSSTGFDEAKDVGFFSRPAEIWLPVPPGHFAIFFPEDAHAPMANPGVALHKLILKIAVD
ncbi:MAG: YhcH/YjgK/YiaL family protein [Lentisphaeria bacterium]